MSFCLYQFLYRFSHYINHPISVNYTSIRLDRGNHLGVADTGTQPRPCVPQGGAPALLSLPAKSLRKRISGLRFLVRQCGNKEDDKINYLSMLKTSLFLPVTIPNTFDLSIHYLQGETHVPFS
jgi:hypothetical protein